MVDGIRVRIIPGCPGLIVAEDGEGKELARDILANAQCGCLVKTEDEIAELTEDEIEGLADTEVEELAEAAIEESAAEVEGKAMLKAAEEMAKERDLEDETPPVCSLEPDKPWEDSVCGVVAEEAGRQAADLVMVRLREEGIIE